MIKERCSYSAAAVQTGSRAFWEGDGFLLLYKLLSDGRFKWPRNTDELKELTDQQYRLLMDGFTIEKGINESHPKYIA